MSAIQVCLSTKVNGRTVGTFRIVRYIVGVRFSGVSVKRGSTVPMYEIIAMCIELATVSRANIMCEYKAGEGVPCYSRSKN